MNVSEDEEAQILEMKVYNKMFFFQVKWKDGSISWTRQSHLSNKSMVLDFLRVALKKLRIRKKEEDEKKNAEEVEKLKDEMIKKPKFAHQKENIVKQERLRFEAPPVSIQEKYDMINLKEKYKNGNFLCINRENKLFIEFKFYDVLYREKVDVDLEQCVFISFHKIFPFLHNFVHNGIFKQRLAEIIGEEAIVNEFTEFIRPQKRCFLTQCKKSFWLLCCPDNPTDNFLRTNKKSFVMFEIKKCEEAKMFFDGFKKQRNIDDFNSEKFGVFQKYHNNEFYSFGEDFKSKFKCHLIANKNLYSGKKLEQVLQETIELTDDIKEASCFVLDEYYAKNVNSIFPTEMIGETQVKNIYVQKKHQLIEIFKESGVFILTRDFLFYGSLDFMVELARFISKTNKWSVKCLRSSYNVFKERLNDIDKVKSQLNRYKEFYNILKANIISGLEFENPHDFKNYVEREISTKIL